MRRLTAFVLLGMIWAAHAYGQGAEIGITGGWGGFTKNTIGQRPSFEGPDEAGRIDNGVRIGARLAINSWVLLGHEINYAWQNSRLRIGDFDVGRMNIHNFYYNFVVHATPEGTKFRPFVTGGVGFSSFFPPGTGSFSGGGETEFGVNFGAGLKVKLTEKYGLRVDVRDHVTKAPFDMPDKPGSLHNVEYSAGFSVLF